MSASRVSCAARREASSSSIERAGSQAPVTHLDQSSLSYLVRKPRDKGFRSQVNREMQSYPSTAQDGHDFANTLYQLFGGEQERGLPIWQQAVVSLLCLLSSCGFCKLSFC